jgi:hypothetical protein
LYVTCGVLKVGLTMSYDGLLNTDINSWVLLKAAITCVLWPYHYLDQYTFFHALFIELAAGLPQLWNGALGGMASGYWGTTVAATIVNA